jgi:tmRNA-binding protein
LSYDVNVKKTTLAATEMYIKDAVGEETDIAINVVKGGTGMNKRNALIKKKKVYFDI